MNELEMGTCTKWYHLENTCLRFALKQLLKSCNACYKYLSLYSLNSFPSSISDPGRSISMLTLFHAALQGIHDHCIHSVKTQKNWEFRWMTRHR